MIVCWSIKGGCGTTVVAATFALLSSRTHPTLLVDLAGDAAAVLGLPDPASPGVADWLASPTADAAALLRLAVPANHSLDVLPLGAGTSTALHSTLPDRWSALASALGDLDQQVVVDAGLGCPPSPLVHEAQASLLVTRSCYLSMRRAVALGSVPTGIVLLLEPGRALTANDVERAVGAPVVAQVPYDPAIARSVDAGLLAARLPSSLSHSLRRAA
jgi:MinD superfamily P-loop ATPase